MTFEGRDWFERVFGFAEKGYDSTRESFQIRKAASGSVSLVHTGQPSPHGSALHVGLFECPSLSELRSKLEGTHAKLGPLTFCHIVSDVSSLHLDEGNAGAVFQVASQFNALEMVDPGVGPEDGITRYVYDHTQGPACALCCPAATLYRNYFCQGQGTQLDLLEDVATLLENASNGYWNMVNGYCLPCGPSSMASLAQRLLHDPVLADKAKAALRVAVHWDAAVHGRAHQVCQVFVSALPVAYSKNTPVSDWETFACVVLEALYDATLAAAAILAFKQGQRVRVFLTAVGGGAFGNRPEWIAKAIQKALDRHRDAPLSVRLVHYSSLPKPGSVFALVTRTTNPANNSTARD